jgi:hypothetical protein
MPQIFHRSSNALAKFLVFGGIFLAAGLGALAMKLDRSPYNTRQGLILEQPVPFSHEHHVSGLGIDCRYCHTSVETAAFAGIPPVATCYNCHSQIWANSQMLAPVRDGFRNGQPIRWVRVHDLPDYVFFDHSIHLAKGVGCVTCHGPIHKDQLTRQFPTLQMKWCLDCHRDPAPFLRPKEQVFNMDWVADPKDGGQAALGARLVRDYKILGPLTLTSCSTCHR